MQSSQALLDVEGLRVAFTSRGNRVVAVRGVSLSVNAGEAVAIVGESGSGKSTFARTLVGLLPAHSSKIEAGTIRFAGQTYRPEQFKTLRGGKIAMIFQDPLSYLNPIMQIGKQIAESVIRHDPAANPRDRVPQLLEQVRLPTAVAQSYPHELSGGMRQRVLIAIALGCKPRLLVADEPTTALDVTTQEEILDLINAIRRELDMALLLITHDLSVVAAVTERVNVMLRGEIIERGSTQDTLRTPQHLYTRGLIRAARGEKDERGRFITVDQTLIPVN